MVNIEGDGAKELVRGSYGVDCDGVSVWVGISSSHIWYDPWSGNLPLKDLYLDLFECLSDWENLIYDVLDRSSLGMVRS